MSKQKYLFRKAVIEILTTALMLVLFCLQDLVIITVMAKRAASCDVPTWNKETEKELECVFPECSFKRADHQLVLDPAF